VNEKQFLGAVNPRTGDFVAHIAKSGNTVSFFQLLMFCVIANRGKKIYMVLDNARFHYAKRLKPIIEKYKDKLELVFLPPYSPDLNPIERVWWLKQVTHNRWVKTMDERIDNFNSWRKQIGKENIQNVCNLIENIY
jgi:putative transposase